MSGPNAAGHERVRRAFDGSPEQMQTVYRRHLFGRLDHPAITAKLGLEVCSVEQLIAQCIVLMIGRCDVAVTERRRDGAVTLRIERIQSGAIRNRELGWCCPRLGDVAVHRQHGRRHSVAAIGTSPSAGHGDHPDRAPCNRKQRRVGSCPESFPKRSHSSR
jgi:hypothetical protein